MKQYFDNRKFDNVFIYPHCLDESFFEEKGQSEVAECDVISVSELIERKRTTDIIEAVALLKAKGTEVKVHILGTGVEMKKMEMLIAQNNLENEVKLLGYQTNILEHLKGSKIFIQASSKEGLSLSLIEAVGAGLVPITTEAGSEKDILTDGLDALFFGIGDTSKLAEKIEFALDENNYRNLNSNVNKLRNELKIDHAIFETEKIQSFLFQKSGHK